MPETFELCTDLIRPGGRVANVGVHGHSATLHLEKLWIRDVLITTGLVDTTTTPKLLRLIESGTARPDAVRHPPLRARGRGAGVRRVRSCGREPRAQGRARSRSGRHASWSSGTRCRSPRSRLRQEGGARSSGAALFRAGFPQRAEASPGCRRPGRAPNTVPMHPRRRHEMSQHETDPVRDRRLAFGRGGAEGSVRARGAARRSAARRLRRASRRCPRSATPATATRTSWPSSPRPSTIA